MLDLQTPSQRASAKLFRASAFMLFAVLPSVTHAQDAPKPAQDILIFTNGDQLSGTLLRSAGGNVFFKSDMAGEISVPLTKVKELRTQGAFAVLKNNEPIAVTRKTQPGKIVLSGSAVTVTANASGTEAVVPVADVAYLLDEKTFNREVHTKPSLLHGWGGTVSLGTTFVQSTTHGGTVTGSVALVRTMPTLSFFAPRNRTLVDFQENYGTLTTPAIPAANLAAVSVKTSIMHADAERDEYVKKNLYLLGTVAFDHSYAQSLDLQQIYGGGVGYTVINTPLQELDVKADAHYEKQQFFGNVGNTNLFGSTFSESYRRSLPLKVSLTQTLAVLPAWNVLNAYQANGSVGLVAPLMRRFSVSLAAADSFLNNPVPGYQKNSFTFTTSLTYTLR
jgi:hypothetical protein